MTSPTGKLTVTVVGDVGDLARQLTADANKALRNVKLNVGPLEDQLGKIGDVGRNAFRELSASSEGVFDELRRDAGRAAEQVADGMEAAGERAEDALGEVGDRGEREMDRVEREARDAGGGMLRSLSGAAVGIGAAFAAIQVGQFFLDAAQDAEDLGSAIENTTQLIKTTGAAAGLTAQQVRELSRSLSLKIGVDSVEVQNAANVLLTFKAVSGETFTQAIGLAADLSAVLGTDLKGATLQLGKALQDPIRGVAALGRAGVQFNTAQKAQIKGFVETNQLAKAQAVILAEVASQVGGVAEAGVDTTDQLKVAFQDLKRVAGTALIGFIDDHGPQLIGLLHTMEPVIAGVGELLATAFEAALPFVEVLAESIKDNFAAIGPAVQPLADVFEALLSLLPAVIPSLVQIGRSVLPILADTIGDVAEAVGPLIALILRLTAQFVTALTPALPPLSRALTSVATALSGALMDALPEVAEAGLNLLDALLPLVPLAVDLLTAVLPLIPPFVSLAAAIASVSIDAIAGPLQALTGFMADNAGAVLAVTAAIVAMSAAARINAVATKAMEAATSLWSRTSATARKSAAGLAATAADAGIGIAAAAVALYSWGQQARHTSDDITGLTEDVKRFVKTGEQTASLRKHFGEGAAAIAEFDDKLDLASAGFFNWADHLNRTLDEISKGKSAFADLDVALSKLVDEGADADVVFQQLVDTYDLTQEQIDQLRRVLPKYGEAAARAKDRTKDLGDAQRDAEKGTLAHADSLKGLGDALRAQTDPVFAFVRQQKAVRDAQKEVTDALNEYGRRSPEYRAAVLNLADEQVGLASATGDAAEATDASLIPALKQMRRDGLLSEDAFNELVGAIDESKRAAKRLDGTRVRVSVKVAIDAALEKLTNLLNRLPKFHDGGIVPGLPGTETLAILKAGERVLPPGEDRRASELLAKAMEQANAALRAVGVPGAGAAGLQPNIAVYVEIDGEQLEGRIIRVAAERDRTLHRRVRSGAGVRR